LRDHRHVTSLLQRIRCETYGVLVRPTLSFDERGHQPNSVTYAVLVAEGYGAAPVGFFPVIEDYVGEGGALDWPQAIVTPGAQPVAAGASIDGYEALGGLRFAAVTLQPGEARTYVLILAILPAVTPGEEDVKALVKTIREALRVGDKVSLSGLGTFKVKSRKARKGRLAR